MLKKLFPMTVSRADMPIKTFPRMVCIFAVAVMVAMAPRHGWGQSPVTGNGSGGPMRLSPVKEPDTPTPATPASSTPEAAPVSQTPAADTATGGKVEIDTLTAIDPDATGVLSKDQGGFGNDMWQGTSRELVDNLLGKLPLNATSTTMRNLIRRLLLSTAASPKGNGKRGGLVALRIRLLAAMGDSVGASQMLNSTPRRSQNPDLIRIEADARFLANDNSRACALAAGQVGISDDPYWQKAFIFCQALAGETDKASMGASLLRDLGEDDPAFFELLDAMSGNGDATIESLANPSPLHLAMARVAKATLPADVISSNNPSILKAIATSPNAPVELRMEAAERAEATGALPVEALRQLYTSVPFSAEDLANPLSRAETESGPLSRALLYRTALIQTVPTAQAEAVARALSLAREGGRYGATVRVFMAALKRIPPSPELLWFAPEALRAFLLSSDTESADAWFGLLNSGAMFEQKASLVLAEMMAVARIAGSANTEEWDEKDFNGWWQRNKEAKERRQRAALLFSIFDALGDSVPDKSWEMLLDGPARTTVAMPNPALWYRLQSAVGSVADSIPSRLGETVLLSLLALGDGGPGQADPVVLHRVIKSLIAVGLETEARSLAVEAAVAAGL